MLAPHHQVAEIVSICPPSHPMKDSGCPPIAFDQPPGHLSVASPPLQQQQKQLGQRPQQLTHQGHHQNQQQSYAQPQHQLPRQSHTISGGSGTLPSSSAEPRRISCQDIQLVQNLIEQCLQLHMNQQEVVSTLLIQAKIEPGFTGLVWQKLEEQNPDFFKAYYTRLMVKHQIVTFNRLLEQQAEMMQKKCPAKAPSSLSNGLHSAPMEHTPIGYSVQQPVIRTPTIHSMQQILVPMNPSLINGEASLPNAVHTSEDISVPSTTGRMEIGLGVLSGLHAHPGLSSGNSNMSLQTASGFSNSSTFPFNAIGNPPETPSTIIDVQVPVFNSNEAHPQSGAGSLQDTDAGCPKDLLGSLGQIPRNFSLSDLAADFSHSSDILGSYSGCPFLTPDTEGFLHSSEKECLDDERMLDTISEPLSYDDFASD